MDLDLGTLAAHIRKDWKEQVDRFMNEMRQTAWSREHRKKPYVTAVILAVLIVAEIFILSGILGYLFGTAGVVLHGIDRCINDSDHAGQNEDGISISEAEMVWYIWLFDPVGRYLAADQRGDTYDGVFFSGPDAECE